VRLDLRQGPDLPNRLEVSQLRQGLGQAGTSRHCGVLQQHRNDRDALIERGLDLKPYRIIRLDNASTAPAHLTPLMAYYAFIV
jgi:hypothetical protein